MKTKIPLTVIILLNTLALLAQPEMYYGDTSRSGKPFSKDPHVIRFEGRYLMYTSAPPSDGGDDGMQGWEIGIINWEKIGSVPPSGKVEAKGICAPCVLVVNDTVHLFYQTYGNWRNDAICHAWSTDGIHFTRNTTNPIFHPTGDWTSGRAIDAEVYSFNNQYYLYFATRDPDMRIQIMGVAVSPLDGDFKRESWTQKCNKPILAPEFPWEGMCTEGASVIQKGEWLYMFYAGAYNNKPQQVGVAKSRDGLKWEKLSNKPFLTNGDPGTWNSSESGHPHIFEDEDGSTYLFFQGNDDNGNTWFISKVEIGWNDSGPYFK
jgi:beta-xylosidase